jgi:hypothetical protein
MELRKRIVNRNTIELYTEASKRNLMWPFHTREMRDTLVARLYSAER